LKKSPSAGLELGFDDAVENGQHAVTSRIDHTAFMIAAGWYDADPWVSR
jgi:hypothetical protein